MAWVLVRLKLRLLTNGLRGRGPRQVGFVVAALYAVGLGSLAFVSLVSLRNRPADLAVVAEIGAVALVIGWATGPLLGFGSDETLDPTRLALLPLRRTELMTGLLAASLAGPAPVGTALALAGAAVAFSSSSPIATVAIVLAAAVELALCVALSRALVTALSAALRSRRGRDLRFLLLALLGLLPETLHLLLFRGHDRLTDLDPLRPWAHALSWAPPVLPIRAMAAAAGGHWPAALAELAGGVVTVGLVLAWWNRSLEVVMTTAESPPGAVAAPAAERRSRTGRGGRVALPLFSPGLESLPRSRAGAVAARELRYTWREPRRRVQLLGGVLVPFLLLAGILTQGGLHRHRIVFAALLVAFVAGNNRAINQFGLDGPAFWIHESSGQDLRADLTGKNLAVALTTLPLAALTALVLAAISGGWAELAMTLGLSVGLLGLLLGAGDVASVLLPIPATDAAGNLWATQGGQGCTQGMLSLLVLAVDAVLASPTVVPALIVHGLVPRLVVVAAALVYGLALYRIGLAIAVRFGRSRGPELLEAIAPRRGP